MYSVFNKNSTFIAFSNSCDKCSQIAIIFSAGARNYQLIFARVYVPVCKISKDEEPVRKLDV